MKIRNIVNVISFALAVMCLWTLPMAAQTNTGDLVGTVTDPSGAIVPGVNVRVTSVSTNIVTVTKTNTAGYYRVGNLLPGMYDARFVRAGFSTLELTNIEITAGVETRRDAQLRVGSARQKVTVAAQAIQIQTSPSNHSTTLPSQLVDNIPLAGRDIQQLAFLIPGVTAVTGPVGANFGFNSQYGSLPDPTHMQGSDLQVNGGPGGTDMWYLDGNFNVVAMADNEAVNPSPDAVQEFQAITNGFAAEYGHTGGGVFNVVLKSGTNQLHGSLYDYERDPDMARNPFTSVSTTGQLLPQKIIHYNDAGGTVGGPVYIPKIYNGRNRTFFFFSYDRNVLDDAGPMPTTLTVPTAAMRNGDFSAQPGITQYGIFNPYSTVGPASNGEFARSAFGTPITPNGCTGYISNGVPVNPTAATCNFATQIPATISTPSGSMPGINSISSYYMQSMPLPNFISPTSTCPVVGGTALCDNYLSNEANSIITDNVSLKVTNQWSPKSTFFADWLYNPSNYGFYRVPWTGASYPGPSVGFGPQYPVLTHNQVVGLGNTYTLSPTAINEFRASFTRQYTATSMGAMNTLMDTSGVQQKLASFGLPSSSYYPVPTLAVTEPFGGSFSMGPADFSNTDQMGEAYTFSDNFTKVIGKHTVKAGLVYQLNHVAWGGGFPTELSFGGTTTDNPVTDLGGSGLADFLMGAVPSGGIGFSGDQIPWYMRFSYWSGFFQDEYQVTKNFTLNVGLRYDVYGYVNPRHHDPLSNFCLACMNPTTGLPGEVLYSGQPGGPPPFGQAYFSPNWTDFAPRFSIAWEPFHDNGKTVIRAGYDMFYSDAVNAVNYPGESITGMPGWFYFSNWEKSYYPNQCASFSGSNCVAFPLAPGNANALASPPVTAQFPATQREALLGTSLYNEEKPSTDPLVQEWNVEIQRQLPGNLLLSVGYTGNHATNMPTQDTRNIDYVPTAEQIKLGEPLSAEAPITNYFSGQTASELASIWGSNELPLSVLLSPFPAFAGVVLEPAMDGNSVYDGLNVQLQKHFSSGFTFVTNYTWSKMIEWPQVVQAGGFTGDPWHDTMPNYLGGRVGYNANAGYGANIYQNPDCRRCDRALATDDIPQMFNFAAVYDFPFGKGRPLMNHSRLLNAFLGGWQLSGNFDAESGIPLTVSGPCDQITCRPNLIGNPKAVPGGQNQNDWINAAAFSPPFGTESQGMWTNYNASSPLTYQWGTAGAVIPGLFSPGFWNLDAALSKRFPVGENKYFQFQFQAFNALNHQNLGYPDTNYCLPPGPNGQVDLVQQAGCSFGRITNIQTDPRSLQFSLRFAF